MSVCPVMVMLEETKSLMLKSKCPLFLVKFSTNSMLISLFKVFILKLEITPPILALKDLTILGTRPNTKLELWNLVDTPGLEQLYVIRELYWTQEIQKTNGLF